MGPSRCNSVQVYMPLSRSGCVLGVAHRPCVWGSRVSLRKWRDCGSLWGAPLGTSSLCSPAWCAVTAHEQTPEFTWRDTSLRR